MENSLKQYKRREKFVSAAYSVGRLIILLSIGYILIYPLFYIISNSVKTPEAFSDPSFVWVPTGVTTNSYKTAIEVMDFWKALSSTLTLEILSSLFQVFSCAVAAYGLSRFKFKGQNVLMFILMLTILVPHQMIIIPLTANFAKLDVFGILGLINNFTGVDLRANLLDTAGTFWIPSLLGVGLRSGVLIYIYIQFFKGLPKELEEAAWIDGANPIQTFFKIAVPSSGVVILTVTVFSVLWHWNDYYLAVMYTSENFPLAVRLAQLPETLTTLGYWSFDGFASGVVLAGCMLFILPMLVLYLIIQKQFIQSIDHVGITG